MHNRTRQTCTSLEPSSTPAPTNSQNTSHYHHGSGFGTYLLAYFMPHSLAIPHAIPNRCSSSFSLYCLHPINPDWPESGFLWTSLPTVCLSWQLYNSQRSPSSPSSTECWSQPSIIRSLRTYSANQWKDRNAFIHDGSTLHAARTSKEAQRSHSCHNTRLQQTGLSSFRRAGTCLWSSPLPLHYSPSIHTGGLARHVESRANSFERPNNPLLQTSTGHYHPISSPAHPTSRTH